MELRSAKNTFTDANVQRPVFGSLPYLVTPPCLRSGQQMIWHENESMTSRVKVWHATTVTDCDTPKALFVSAYF